MGETLSVRNGFTALFCKPVGMNIPPSTPPRLSLENSISRAVGRGYFIHTNSIVYFWQMLHVAGADISYKYLHAYLHAHLLHYT